jgi:alpha-galactosidase
MKGDWAVCFLNRSVKAQKIDFDWSKNVVADTVSHRILNTNETVFTLRNLWMKKNIGSTKKNLQAVIPSHDVLVARLGKK